MLTTLRAVLSARRWSAGFANPRTVSQEVRAKLELERLAAMHEAGLTDDHVSTPSEARRLRYYDAPSTTTSLPSRSPTTERLSTRAAPGSRIRSFMKRRYASQDTRPLSRVPDRAGDSFTSQRTRA